MNMLFYIAKVCSITRAGRPVPPNIVKEIKEKIEQSENNPNTEKKSIIGEKKNEEKKIIIETQKPIEPPKNKERRASPFSKAAVSFSIPTSSL